MRSTRPIALLSVLVMMLAVSPPILAGAEPKEPPAFCRYKDCAVKVTASPETGDNDDELLPGDADSEQYKKASTAKKASDSEWAKYNNALRARDKCLTDFTPSAAAPTPACGPVPKMPDDIYLSLTDGFNGGPPLLTPAQAGAIAVARLRIPTVAPGIGPSPELNRWKMAAVGYPLWLWADGPTQVGPVSDSVGGLSVSLEARLAKVTFRMGDGETVNCAGHGSKWTRAVKPGTKSPNCGYSYTKPSLPEGSYTVTAISNWAVTWSVNDESGVINVPSVDTAELPVGELQVLVR